ncbi:MAG: heavy-metal-associated domain-containing protein [Erysipelotrichaceae bacterium]|nr:heavy-metal-associated domain-containing protein [Erysipelotrichaceae bacterium]
MNKVTLKIDGMMCGMCEAHISDTIHKTIPEAKKVSSSFRKGESTFLYEGELDEEKLKEAIKETGYELRSLSSEPYTKKWGLF